MDDFCHLDALLAVTVDAAGRTFVADQWGDRVQVFDSSGAYLTTIGGSGGSRTGQMRSASGLAVDALGNLYVAERENHRIQKLAPGVPGWRQVNINGFGERSNRCALSLTPFGTDLYAGTYSWSGDGAQLWRQTAVGGWSLAKTGGLVNAANEGIDHLIEFDGQLYAGTWANDVNGGEVWRSGNGTNWVRVVSQGFGDSTNAEVFRFAVFDNQLYASTYSYSASHGGEVWRSATGDSGDWAQVVSDGFDGDANNVSVLSFEGFNGHLYAGTWNYTTGGEVWRSPSGDSGTWTQVNTDGFGGGGNGAVSALAAFDGSLYASTGHTSGAGSQLWRCQDCDGSDWEKVVDNGQGNADSRTMPALEVFEGRLYFVIGNRTTGLEVWRTADGSSWEQIGFAGLGDSNNNYAYWDNSVTVSGSRFFVSTCNGANGGEVWLYLTAKVYLPLVVRSQ